MLRVLTLITKPEKKTLKQFRLWQAAKNVAEVESGSTFCNKICACCVLTGLTQPCFVNPVCGTTPAARNFIQSEVSIHRTVF